MFRLCKTRVGNDLFLRRRGRLSRLPVLRMASSPKKTPPATPQSINRFFEEQMAGSVPTKYRMAHLINGTLDSANIAPMGGVTTYPYKVNEKLYQDECVAASRPHDHALPSCLVPPQSPCLLHCLPRVTRLTPARILVARPPPPQLHGHRRVALLAPLLDDSQARGLPPLRHPHQLELR